MILRSTVLCMLGVGIAGLLAACGTSRSMPGEDRRTQSNASVVTWTDGKEAIAISCQGPSGCQARAVAMCQQTNGAYTVLKMENMPSRGDLTVVRGPASVVIRCGR
jgi:hypothetical protein